MLKKSTLKYCLSILCLLGFGFLHQVAAQPSDAELKKQLTAPRTVAITLGKPGKVEWSSTYKKYVWSRNFTSKLKTEDTGIFLIVKGYASYDVVAGRYVFWRTFTTSNSYEGLPDPTESDVQKLLAKFGIENVLGEFHLNQVVGNVDSVKLAAEPKYEWHTMNSVSFNVIATYNMKTNDVGRHERVAHTLRLRIYRDNPRSEWRNILSSSLDKKPL